MGIEYLWDTNTVIYFLQGQMPLSGLELIDRSLQNSIPAISAISEIELLCWKANSQEDMKLLKSFLSEIHIIELEEDIKQMTAELRKRYNVKLPDAIIAATAISYKVPLITRNTKDFKRVEELSIIDPFNI